MKEEIVINYLKNNRYPSFVKDILKGINLNSKNKSSEEDIKDCLEKLYKSGKIKKYNDKYEFVPDLFKKEVDLYNPLILWLENKMQINAKYFPQSGGNGIRGVNEWLYPDLIGIKEFPRKLSNLIRLIGKGKDIYCFEVKKNVNRSQIRKFFFQCLANSSWANYRYLVVTEITPDAKLEFKRLAQRYGMGLIVLSLARENDKLYCKEDETIIEVESPRYELDIESINNIVEENRWPIFTEWLSEI